MRACAQCVPVQRSEDGADIASLPLGIGILIRFTHMKKAPPSEKNLNSTVLKCIRDPRPEVKETKRMKTKNIQGGTEGLRQESRYSVQIKGQALF